MQMLIDALVTMFIGFWVFALGAVCVIAAFVTLADPGMLRWLLACRSPRRRIANPGGHPDCTQDDRRPVSDVAYPRTQPIPPDVLDALCAMDTSGAPSGFTNLPAAHSAPALGSAPAQDGAGSAAPAVGSEQDVWFGPYRREGLIAEGSSGQVWRVFDTRTGRQVALKHLRPELAGDPTTRVRLAREASRLAGITARHVIGVLEHGEIDGQPYLVMPLAGAGDLARLLRARPDGVDPAEAVEIVTQVAEGLDAIHAAGWAHRDLKPANIVLTPGRGGAERHCHLIDLEISAPLAGRHPTGSTPTGSTPAPAGPNQSGVAVTRAAGDSGANLTDCEQRAAARDGEDGDLRLTPAGCVAGTPAYMAPELLTSVAGAASVSSDVYALGVLAHQLLTGSLPFSGPGTIATAWQQCHLPAPPPSTVRGGLARFDAVLARALAKNPADRHPSPAALAADLARVAHTSGPATARTPNPSRKRSRRATRRRPAAAQPAALAG